MRKFGFSNLVVILSLLCFGVTPANATNDYSQCPNTWKLTTSDDSAVEKELAEAKALLGTNMAITVTSREIQTSGAWKVFSNEKFNSNEISWLQLLQYPMRSNFKIEVKGCPLALNLSRPLTLGNIAVIQSSYSTLYEDMLKALPQNSSPADLSSRLRKLDFKQLEDSINTLKQSVQNRVNDLKSGKNGALRGSFRYNDGAKSRTSVLLMLGPVTDQAIGIWGQIELLPEKLSCVVLGVDIVSAQTPMPFKWVPANTSCSYQLIAYLPTIKTIFMIDSVKIETVTTEIYCTKGKTTRKITGLNPKCPAGFKKK
jgi:hypothetical protein